MNRPLLLAISQKGLALVAVLFGVLTIVAGSRVLTGIDPPYVVFTPLLIYNTAMGFVYVGVGAIAWRRLDPGKIGAGAIFLLNLIVLIAISVLYMSGGVVAIDSLLAMILRTVLWFVIFVGLSWLGRVEGRLSQQ